MFLGAGRLGQGPRRVRCPLAQDLVDQPHRADRQGDQAPLPRRRDLPEQNAAVIRLVGAILLDMHDEWDAAERRYLSEGSMAKPYTTGDNELVALDSGA